jgi:hypothetical protein
VQCEHAARQHRGRGRAVAAAAARDGQEGHRLHRLAGGAGGEGEAGTAGAQAGARRQGDRKGEAGRDRGIRRIAAGREHGARGQRGLRLVGHGAAEEARDEARGAFLRAAGGCQAVGHRSQRAAAGGGQGDAEEDGERADW